MLKVAYLGLSQLPVFDEVTVVYTSYFCAWTYPRLAKHNRNVRIRVVLIFSITD
jgi:hypothetical protein